MNALSDEVWSRGVSYQEYRATVTRNQTVFDEVHARPSYQASDLALLRKLPPLRLLAIAEDWCPDVCHTLPTWARLVEELAGWEIKVFRRDDHPGLMDAYVWDGGNRRVPVYAFHDVGGRLQVWWSGRGAEAEETVNRLLAGRSFADLDEAERADIGRAFDDSYRSALRRRNFEEILDLLAAFFHLPDRAEGME